MARKQISRYLDARSKWIAAGKPTRSDAEVASLFVICKACPSYKPHGRRYGKCKLCGCSLNLGKTLNKLRWATEACPDEPPRWTATVTPPSDPVATDSRREPQVAEDRKQALALDRASRKAAPGPITFPEPTDNLRTYSRDVQPMQGHPLRDLWRPSPGFLVCGGPSLRDLDLGFLRDRGVVSLGVNNVAGLAHTRAMTFSDPPEKFHHGILLDPTILKLVPRTKLRKRVRAKLPDGTFRWTRFRVQDCPSVYGYERDGDWDAEHFLTREAATWGCSKGCVQATRREKVIFTFFLGLRLLHYLGCRRVYMLGVDFSMQPGSTSYAWGEQRDDDHASGNNRYYRLANEMSRELLPHFEEQSYEVFNCNPASRLTAFPHVPLERAIADCKQLIPPEPYDLTEWYDKGN